MLKWQAKEDRLQQKLKKLREMQRALEEKDQLHYKIFDAMTFNYFNKKNDNFEMNSQDNKKLRILRKKKAAVGGKDEEFK